MRRHLPPLNALVAFDAVSRAGSFSNAARSLRIAQPAVTRHVAKLEDWMGRKLFLRSGNSISLTQDGAELAELATSLLDRLELGTQGIMRRATREVVIGASFGITHLWLMPKVTKLQSQARVPFNFLTSDDYRAFDTPDVDMSIRFGNGAFGGRASDLLFPETCQIVVARSYLDANPHFDPADPIGTAPADDLLDHRDTFGVGWMNWQLFCKMIGRTWPQNTELRSLQSYPLMLDLVARGEGVCIGTHGLEDNLVADEQLLRVGPAITRPGFGYFLVYEDRRTTDQAFKAIRRNLTS